MDKTFIFGVDSMIPYNRSTRKPIAFLQAVAECNLNFSAEYVELKGGSSLFALDAELGGMKAEASFTAREYPVEMMEMLLGGSLTTFTPNVAGEVSGFANIKGTSVKSTVTGVNDVILTTGESADLKFGEYVLVAKTTKILELYALSRVDFATGAALPSTDGKLKLGEFDFTTVADKPITGLGVTLDAGSGTITFVVGDSASFFIRKPNFNGFSMVVGAAESSFSEFGMYAIGKKKSDGQIIMLDIFKCKAAGMPISFKENAYSEWQVNLQVLWDSEKNASYKILGTRPNAF